MSYLNTLKMVDADKCEANFTNLFKSREHMQENIDKLENEITKLNKKIDRMNEFISALLSPAYSNYLFLCESDIPVNIMAQDLINNKKKELTEKIYDRIIKFNNLIK